MNAILDQFVTRVQSAVKARSKNINLTLDEGQAIVAEITKLMTRDSSIVDQINALISSSQTTRFAKSDIAPADTVVLSGGRFTDEQN